MYKITITEIKKEVSTRREWKALSGSGESTQYGYTPELPCVNEVEFTRLSQTVDAIDLPAVIRAINGL